ncbi:MAG: DUF378 domain-containing protein [Clostridia bacterium]|nr:DUF378 domain-containing protein [Clostridia bacterium]
MKILNCIAWIILIIGGINWLLIGLASWNLVGAIFGATGIFSRIIYCLVGLSAIWLIISPIMHRGRISLWGEDHSNR